MPELRSEMLVTDRRRNGRSSLSSGKPGSASGVSLDRRTPRKPLVEVVEAVEVVPDLTIEQRREIIDRRRQDRRRQIDPTTCERDYSGGEVEFMRAMDDYKRKSGRPFPTWSEVLEVLLSLGYRKVADQSTLEWRTFGENMGSL